VVSELDTLAGGCVLCHEVDFQRGGFGPRTIMLCDQCEREFHVGCLKKCGKCELDAVPEGERVGGAGGVAWMGRGWLHNMGMGAWVGYVGCEMWACGTVRFSFFGARGVWDGPSEPCPLAVHDAMPLLPTPCTAYCTCTACLQATGTAPRSASASAA